MRRRLPPEPPQTSEAPPPPLPSRPNFKPAPPKPIASVNRKISRRRSPSPDEGETYEVPDLAPSGRGKSLTPPPAEQMDGELYDELDGIAAGTTQQNAKPIPPPPEQNDQEIYDQCELKDADDGELYEDPNEPAVSEEEEEEEGGELYAAPDQSVLPNHRAPPKPPATNTIPDDNDGDSGQNSFKDQLDLARQSLKKRSPQQNITEKSPLKNATNNNLYYMKSTKPETEPTPPDTTKLTISQRIAMMHGQKIGSCNVPLASPSKTNHVAPKPAVRNIKPVAQTMSKPLLPVKPKAPEKKMGNTWNVRKLPETKVQTNQQVPAVTPPLNRNEEPTPPPYAEEIYDDALAFLPKDPLDDEKWYHADRDRKECESDITKKGQDGSYLVRNSTNKAGEQPYTLVVLYKGHVYNLRIRKRADGKIALGNEKELEEELAFENVPELISHHTTNEVILINQKEKTQYRALLKVPLQKAS